VQNLRGAALFALLPVLRAASITCFVQYVEYNDCKRDWLNEQDFLREAYVATGSSLPNECCHKGFVKRQIASQSLSTPVPA